MNRKKKIKKPPKCCHPNCLECPYVDCRYDRLEEEDFTESNNRDYELFEAWNGYKLHKPADKDYQNARNNAHQRKNRKNVYSRYAEYYKKYYADNCERIKAQKRENYDTKKNTIKCRKYRRKHIEHRTEYEKNYYELHKEEIKRKARERYHKKKLEKEGLT